MDGMAAGPGGRASEGQANANEKGGKIKMSEFRSVPTFDIFKNHISSLFCCY
jgi:hypothetical protein